MKSNIIELKDTVFNQGYPSYAAKYEDSIQTIINYVQPKYSMGVYLRQAILEWKVLDLALLTKPKKEKNQSDAEFDKEVFEWKDNAKTVLIRRRNIEEGK